MAAVAGIRLHVVRALQVLPHIATSSRAEGLDRIELAFFHAGGIMVSHDGHGFAAMDTVGIDRVTIEIATAYDRVRLSVQSDLVRFHDLQG